MQRPYFLWDYSLTNKQIRAILQGNNDIEKLWLIGRILTHAKFDDVWRYLKVKQIVAVFPKLRLPHQSKQAWQRALIAWGYHV